MIYMEEHELHEKKHKLKCYGQLVV